MTLQRKRTAALRIICLPFAVALAGAARSRPLAPEALRYNHTLSSAQAQFERLGINAGLDIEVRTGAFALCPAARRYSPDEQLMPSFAVSSTGSRYAVRAFAMNADGGLNR